MGWPGPPSTTCSSSQWWLSANLLPSPHFLHLLVQPCQALNTKRKRAHPEKRRVLSTGESQQDGHAPQRGLVQGAAKTLESSTSLWAWGRRGGRRRRPERRCSPTSGKTSGHGRGRCSREGIPHRQGRRKPNGLPEEQAGGPCKAEALESKSKAGVGGEPEAGTIHHMLSPAADAKGHCANSYILRGTCLPPNAPQGNLRASCLGHLQAHVPCTHDQQPCPSCQGQWPVASATTAISTYLPGSKVLLRNQGTKLKHRGRT